MAGHTPRHRVDSVAHGRAVGFKEIAEFLHGVLRLRHRHTIARNNDHTGGRFEDVVGLFKRSPLSSRR